jgi:hypothetical protein
VNLLTALEILRAARDRAQHEPVKTPEVRQALTALNRHCREGDRLVWFWEWADYSNAIARRQNLHAALNGILRQLGLPPE